LDPLNAPLVLWLQGGPGGSSLFGQFELHGPYLAVYNWYGKLHAKLNPYAWNKKVNIIYIDNPVSVGKDFINTMTSKSLTVKKNKRKLVV
jgi:vitellogenic carboxypeptidase-like protein